MVNYFSGVQLWYAQSLLGLFGVACLIWTWIVNRSEIVWFGIYVYMTTCNETKQPCYNSTSKVKRQDSFTSAQLIHAMTTANNILFLYENK